MKTASLCVLFAAAAFLAGCANPRPGYGRPGEIRFGSPAQPTASEKAAMCADAVEKLLLDPVFSAKYEAKKASLAGGAFPTIACAPIENNVRWDSRSDAAATGQMTRDLLAALRKTGRFEVTDDLVAKRVLDRLSKGVDELGEDSGQLSGIGSFASVDYYMTGDLSGDDSGGVWTYVLNLELTDTATKNVFWGDSVKIEKREPRR